MEKEKKWYKMVHLSGEAGVECADLLDEVKKLIQDDQKRKIYNTELVLLALRALKVSVLRTREENKAIEQHFGKIGKD